MEKVNNKIGFNLLLWELSISKKSMEATELLKKIGYDGVEIYLADMANEKYIDFRNFLNGMQMEATSCFILGKEENPIDKSKTIRKKAVERLKWAVDRSNDIDCKIICGPVHSAFSTFDSAPATEDDYKRASEVLYEAGEYAKKSNVVFAVEAINRFECYLCNTVDQLNKIVELTNHSNVLAMYDTFHANIEEKNQLGVRKLKNSLAHVHISENDRGTPGDGQIPFDNVFIELTKINYKGWLTIEAFSRMDPGFSNSMNVWREYSKPLEIATKGYNLIKTMQDKHMN